MTEEERQMLEEMGDDSGGGSDKKKKLMRMGMLAGIILIQVAAAWAVAQFLILPRMPGDPTAADSLGLVMGEDGEPIPLENEVEEEVAPEDRERGTILMMDQVVVNLIGIEGTHFLQVTAGLEYSEGKLEAEIGERMPELRDLLIDHLSSRNIEDVINREGREVVKEDILDEFNKRLQAGDLLNIYFSDFVVQ